MAIIVYFISGLWGLYLCFKIVAISFGSKVALLSLVIFPGLLAIAPWYAFFALGDWLPFVVVYGGFILALIIGSIESR